MDYRGCNKKIFERHQKMASKTRQNLQEDIKRSRRLELVQSSKTGSFANSTHPIQSYEIRMKTKNLRGEIEKLDLFLLHEVVLG